MEYSILFHFFKRQVGNGMPTLYRPACADYFVLRNVFVGLGKKIKQKRAQEPYTG